MFLFKVRYSILGAFMDWNSSHLKNKNYTLTLATPFGPNSGLSPNDPIFLQVFSHPMPLGAKNGALYLPILISYNMSAPFPRGPLHMGVKCRWHLFKFFQYFHFFKEKKMKFKCFGVTFSINMKTFELIGTNTVLAYDICSNGSAQGTINLRTYYRNCFYPIYDADTQLSFLI